MKFRLFLAVLVLFACAALSSPVAASTAIAHSNTTALSNGLVGYWTLDGSQTNWATGITNDSSGNGYNGSLVSMSTTTSPVAGKIGGALFFPGTPSSSHYVQVANGPIISGLNSWTMAVWMKKQPGPFGGNGIPVYTERAGGGNDIVKMDGFDSHLHNTELTLRDDGGTLLQLAGSKVIDDNKWHFVVHVKNGSNIIIYVDGVVDVTGTWSGTNNFTNAVVSRIGGDLGDSSANFNGAIDDMRLYNRALSAQEIKQLYAQGAATVAHSNANTLANGLTGYWPLDGNTINWTTGTVRDASGNGNTGTMIGMSTTTSPIAGKIGGALNFNGLVPGSYISTPSENISGSVAVSAWVKSSNFNQGGGMVVEKDPVNAQWELFVSSGVLYWRGAGTDSNTTCAAPSNNKWHHLVGQQSGTATAIYIDGVLCASGSSTAFTDSGGNINIGAFTGGFYFFGAIDDVRIYNRTLSAQEIQQLYAQGTVIVAHSNTVALSNGLLGHWPLNGPATSWITDTTQDTSGNGNTGTMIGMSTTTSPVAGKIGGALQFNGASSYVVPGVNLPLSNDNTPDTVSAWFKTSSDGVVLSSQNGVPAAGTYDPLLYIETNGYLHGGGYNGGFPNLQSSTALNDNKWHFALLTYDGATQTLYIDGAFVAQAGGSRGGGSSSGGTNYWTIGEGEANGWPNTNNSTFYFNGAIDDARIYNRVLSASEIKQLYLMGK